LAACETPHPRGLESGGHGPRAQQPGKAATAEGGLSGATPAGQRWRRDLVLSPRPLLWQPPRRVESRLTQLRVAALAPSRLLRAREACRCAHFVEGFSPRGGGARGFAAGRRPALTAQVSATTCLSHEARGERCLRRSRTRASDGCTRRKCGQCGSPLPLPAQFGRLVGTAVAGALGEPAPDAHAHLHPRQCCLPTPRRRRSPTRRLRLPRLRCPRRVAAPASQWAITAHATAPSASTRRRCPMPTPQRAPAPAGASAPQRPLSPCIAHPPILHYRLTAAPPPHPAIFLSPPLPRRRTCARA
jgi:hypothetical protein